MVVSGHDAGFSTSFTRISFVLAYFGGSRYTVPGARPSEVFLYALYQSSLITLKCLGIYIPLVLELFLDDCAGYWHWFVRPICGYVVLFSVIDFPNWALKYYADDHVLMAVPELYWYGREGKWFGMRQFVVYMLDGVVQVRLFCPSSNCLHNLIDIQQ